MRRASGSRATIGLWFAGVVVVGGVLLTVATLAGDSRAVRVTLAEQSLRGGVGAASVRREIVARDPGPMDLATPVRRRSAKPGVVDDPCARAIEAIAALEATHGLLGDRAAERVEREGMWGAALRPPGTPPPTAGAATEPQFDCDARDVPTIHDVVVQCLSHDPQHAHFRELVELATLPDVFARVWRIAVLESPVTARLDLGEARAALARFEARYSDACERGRTLDPELANPERAGIAGGALLAVHLELLLRSPRLPLDERELKNPHRDDWWWRDTLGPPLAFLLGPSLIETPAIRANDNLTAATDVDHARSAASALIATLLARDRDDLARALAALVLHHPDLAFDERTDSPSPTAMTRPQRAAVSVSEGVVWLLAHWVDEGDRRALPPIDRRLFERKHPYHALHAVRKLGSLPEAEAALRAILADATAAPGDRARALTQLRWRMRPSTILALTEDADPLIAAAALRVAGDWLLTPFHLARASGTRSFPYRREDGTEAVEVVDVRKLHTEALVRAIAVAQDPAAPVEARLMATLLLHARGPLPDADLVLLLEKLMRDPDGVVAYAASCALAAQIPPPPEHAHRAWLADSTLAPEARAILTDDYWTTYRWGRYRALRNELEAMDAGAEQAAARRDLAAALDRARAEAVAAYERIATDPALARWLDPPVAATRLDAPREPAPLFDIDSPVTAAHRDARDRLLLFLGHADEWR